MEYRIPHNKGKIKYAILFNDGTEIIVFAKSKNDAINKSIIKLREKMLKNTENYSYSWKRKTYKELKKEVNLVYSKKDIKHSDNDYTD